MTLDIGIWTLLAICLAFTAVGWAMRSYCPDPDGMEAEVRNAYARGWYVAREGTRLAIASLAVARDQEELAREIMEIPLPTPASTIGGEG
jgi:hypothetical protein